MKALAAVLAGLAVAIALLLRTFAAAPLPEPSPLVAELPAAAPPAGMAVFQVPTGITRRNAAFGYRGGSFSEKRDFAMNAVLVRHPRGDLLVDAGFGRRVDAQVRELPFLLRQVAAYELHEPAADQLASVGYDARNLRGILLTHAHWDHVSGVEDFPGVPVLVPAAEREFIHEGGFATAVARGIEGVPYEEYTFEDGAYLGFASSHDVHHDGSIVVVPAPGHTPGSVIVFLALPDGRRYALVGDLVWQLEGIREREERPWLLQKLADHDVHGVREHLLHVAAIAAKFPQIEIVPAHDQRAYASMARLGDAAR